jgi:hypothetical protein
MKWQGSPTSLLMVTGPSALTVLRSAPLHPVVGVLLNDRSAAPVPAEERIEVEDARRVIAVDRLEPLQLQYELRHHDRAVLRPQGHDLAVPLRVRWSVRRRRRRALVGEEADVRPSKSRRTKKFGSGLSETVGTY